MSECGGECKVAKYFIILVAVVTVIVAAYFFAGGYKNATRINPQNKPFAEAVVLKDNALYNFYKVSKDLYRSAQPDLTGLLQAKDMGFKSVINLRELHSDSEIALEAGIKEIRIKSTAAKINESEVVEFLKAMNNPENLPALVHCKHGSDRTGTMCAFYRIVFEGWSKEDAIDELTHGGFGYHKIYNSHIPPFIKNADIDALKKEAGIGSK